MLVIADFPSGNGQGFHAFRFSRALGSTPGFAFQVKREEFDELFFRHAAACGVDARDDARVTRLAFSVRGATACVETKVEPLIGRRLAAFKLHYYVLSLRHLPETRQEPT